MEKVLLMLRKGPERKPVPTKVQLGWLLQVQERLEDPPLHVEPVCSSVCDIVDEVCHALRSSRDENARELVRLLRSSHLKALLETHDAVVERKEAPPSKPEPSLLAMPTNERMEAVRVVGLRRQPDEPLVRIRYSIINGMFENIEDVRMSESFHSKDKMIGKVFEHFWICTFLNWITPKNWEYWINLDSFLEESMADEHINKEVYIYTVWTTFSIVDSSFRSLREKIPIPNRI